MAKVKSSKKSIKGSDKGNKPKLSAKAIIKRKIMKGKTIGWEPRKNKGVVYVSHIPHGFYAEQIENYFQQFGKVTAVSVPRSKTGKSKGYAFVEFKHPEVAEIAADTMNNYLMFNRLIKAKYIPPKETKPQYILAAKASVLLQKTVPQKHTKDIDKYRFLKNRPLVGKREEKAKSRLSKKKRHMEKTIKSIGVDYNFEERSDDVGPAYKKIINSRKRKSESSEDIENNLKKKPSFEVIPETASIETPTTSTNYLGPVTKKLPKIKTTVDKNALTRDIPKTIPMKTPKTNSKNNPKKTSKESPKLHLKKSKKITTKNIPRTISQTIRKNPMRKQKSAEKTKVESKKVTRKKIISKSQPSSPHKLIVNKSRKSY